MIHLGFLFIPRSSVRIFVPPLHFIELLPLVDSLSTWRHDLLRFVPLVGLRFTVFFSPRHVWIPPTFHAFCAFDAFATLAASRVATSMPNSITRAWHLPGQYSKLPKPSVAD
jgi:hypothetical protein